MVEWTGEGATFYTERTLQILSGYYQKAKNFLAFGSSEGNASFVQAIEGIINRIKPIIENMKPVFDKISNSFAMTAAVVNQELKPAFDDLGKAFADLWKALGPILKQDLINILKGIAIGIAGVIAFVLGIFTGIVEGIAVALPFIVKAFEGLVQFIRGIVQIITGILTGDLGLAWEGVKQTFAGAVEFIANGILSILKFISGFVQGVIGFFMALYNALVGHSIVPDMVNAIVAWFMSLPGSVYNAIVSLVTLVPQVFKDAWSSVTGIVAGWVSDVYNWGTNIARSFADGFSKLGDWLKDKINDALNSAKKFLQGKSPPVAGPFKDIDIWGENVGAAWVNGINKAVSALTLDNPMNTPAPAFAPSSGNTPITQPGGRTAPLVNIEQMNVRDESDITDIARELGFRIELSPGYTQNG